MSTPEHFGAVVIGSGFGGAVTAYRLAERGRKVCLLERGKAYPPNSFPRAPYELSKNFWDPSKGLYGMFNVWSFRGSGAVVSSGLGGGSLIYANVMRRKDERWFKEDLPGGGFQEWPVRYADLEPHYGAVERMMNAQKYPLSDPKFPKPPKTLAMQEAARQLATGSPADPKWIPLNLAVSFRSKPVAHPDENSANNPPCVGAPIEEPHGNIHAMPRTTCRLCGECDIGCNYGSKNTLDYTYISAAHRLGACVRTLCEVKAIEPARVNGGDGYAVTYVVHRPEKFAGVELDTDDQALCPPTRITCDRLILAAGSFGSTYLLLRNRGAFRGLGPALGTRYSVNGDLLSFIIDAKQTKNGKRVPLALDASFGPVITSAIRFADALDGSGEAGRGFYVEDGGNPYLVSWASELSGITGYLRRLVHFLVLNVKYRFGLSLDADLGAEISELLGDCETSRSSMPVLTMGRDRATGHVTLNGKYLDCDWDEQGSADYYDRVVREVTRIAHALGARYADNPSFKWNFQQVLSAHPLGGCPMGHDPGDGVVDAYGEVFGHPGLYVADGAVLPGPVGPNPSLTIAALADRFAGHIR